MLINREKCSGCFACVQACPMHCIGKEEDKQGNVYPVVNAEICISCGKCEKVCAEQHLNDMSFRKSRKCYAAWSRDQDVRKNSASGGIASALYEMALQRGYMICGALYDRSFRVVHLLTEDSDRITQFRQSKYVFSETGNVYEEIRRQLASGRKVLFISLPCKVAGLLNYLGKPDDNLLTADIVCHGTPPYRHLEEHIKTKDPGKKASSLRFRDENVFKFLLENAEGVIYRKTGRCDAYLAAFLEGLNYRESCYRCSFARPERISDITLCDFWGLGKEKEWKHPYTGAISAVLLNTAAGEAFFEGVKPILCCETRDVEEAIEGNSQLRHPTPLHPKRRLFEELYIRQGFESAVKACLSDEMKAEMTAVTKRELRQRLRGLAVRFMKQVGK